MDTLDIIAGRVLKCRVLKKNPIIVQLSSILFWGGNIMLNVSVAFLCVWRFCFVFTLWLLHVYLFSCMNF